MGAALHLGPRHNLAFVRARLRTPDSVATPRTRLAIRSVNNVPHVSNLPARADRQVDTEPHATEIKRGQVEHLAVLWIDVYPRKGKDLIAPESVVAFPVGCIDHDRAVVGVRIVRIEPGDGRVGP